LIGLGVLFGLAALTRNEFVWLGLAWIAVVWRADGGSRMRRQRMRLVAIPAVIGAAILAPWLVRDWATFGNPLPGQAAANALSVTGFDIFAYEQPPTLARYLAQGPGWLAEVRLEGVSHNLLSVLLIPSFPVGVLGLIALPWTARDRALRPLLILAVLTFTATTLLFPVSTTWGTFLHAAGPVHVLLIVSCLVGLDLLIVRVGRWRGWTRPVAWLAPTLTLAVAVLFSVAIVGYGNQARTVALRYDVLGAELTDAGLPPDRIGPVITDFPIWFAEETGHHAIALPNEPPSSILDLAQAFSPPARLLVVDPDNGGVWPAAILDGVPGSECFVPLDLPDDPAHPGALDHFLAFRIRCP
jgi:hypothetical protein